jgi:hypothetical protein
VGSAIISEHLLTHWNSIFARGMDTHVARRVTEAVVRARSRVHLARFDRLDAARCQAKVLLGLLHRAQRTQFGLQHDFRRIRTEEDYRRLVPVTTGAALTRAFWQTAPTVAGSTWPAPLAGVASFDTGEKGLRPVLLSPEWFASRRAALRTALSLVFDAYPLAQLLSGHSLFLGGPMNVAAGTPQTSEAVLCYCLPRWWRPFSMVAAGRAGRGIEGADLALTALAQRCGTLPLTLACGSVAELLPLFGRVKALARRDRITDVWPGLRAVMYTCRIAERGLVGQLRGEIGPGVRLLEVGRFPEGVVAVEDPRHGHLRLLPDHGLYYEFIPAEETGNRAPRRLSLAQVQTGVPYELALTSPGGLWACRMGVGVCFERLDVPLFRFVEAPWIEATLPSDPRSAKEAPAVGLKVQGPHRRSAGTPAERPESFAHNPWLVPVDRE